jgi:predicted HAD superfamily phosphohydrolase YqeG
MRINLTPKEVCAIGDQVFTDILGAKLFHMKTIYIIPINSNDDSGWTKFIRLFERLLFKKWIKKIFMI